MKSNGKLGVIAALCALLFIVVTQLASAQTAPEILGVRLGMDKQTAHRQLQKLGKLEKEERKQQEVWVLFNEPRYSHLIVAFNKEYTQVRFVTAKAREGGNRVRYEEVIDLKKARPTIATNNYKYVLQAPPDGQRPVYVIVARGTDPQYLTYYSIETLE